MGGIVSLGVDLPNIAITTEMLKPLAEGVVANIGVLLPVGIGIMAVMIGAKLIPSFLGRFIHV